MGAAWLLGWCATGCNGGEQEAAEAAVIAEQDAARIVAEQLCAQRMECDCVDPTGPAGEDPEAYTRARCIENRMLEVEHWQQQAMDLGLRYDGACLARKLARTASIGCSDSDRSSARIFAEPSCDIACMVYVGDLELGEECTPGGAASCSQGLRCAYNETSSGLRGPSYRCVSDCNGEGSQCLNGGGCAPWLVCGNGGYCQRAPVLGESCDSYQCQPGAQCDYDFVPTCVALLEDGEACNFNSSPQCRGTCENGVCVPGRAVVCDIDVRDPL